MPPVPNTEVPAQQLADRLAALNRIARIMSDVTDLPGALDRATAAAGGLFPERDIAVWLADACHRRLSRASLYLAGPGLPVNDMADVAIPGDRLLEGLRDTGKPLVWNEDLGQSNSGFLDRLLGEAGYHCLTLVPLLARGRFLGLLMVASRVGQSLCDGEETELAGAVTHQLAGAVEAAALLTELRETNRVLAAQKAFFQTVVDVAPGPIFVKDRAGRFILANRAVGSLLGRAPAEIIGCTDEDNGVDPDTARLWRAVNREVMDSGVVRHHPEQAIPNTLLGERWFQTLIAPFYDLDGEVQGVIGALTDITERKRAHEALSEQRRFLQSVIDVSPGPIWVKDLDGHYLLINRSGAAIFGTTPEAMLGRTDRDTYLGEPEVDAWQAENRRVAETGETLLISERMIPGMDGQPRWFRVAIAPLADAGGAARGVIVSATEISERVQAEQRLAGANQELQRLAQQDGLTGLANRRQLNRVLAQEWRRLRRLGGSLAVAMLDVDHFKVYNDRQGHLAGDDCLRQVATAVSGVLHRPADLAGRFGGEEFLLILPDTDREGALAVARAITRAVAALAIPHPGSPLGRITVSLGVATMMPDEDSPDRLVDAADRALYQAKASGRNRVALAPVVD